MTALSALCLRRLGYDPTRFRPDELRKKLPDIFRAVMSEANETKSWLELVKSAIPPDLFRGRE